MNCIPYLYYPVDSSRLLFLSRAVSSRDTRSKKLSRRGGTIFQIKKRDSPTYSLLCLKKSHSTQSGELHWKRVRQTKSSSGYSQTDKVEDARLQVFFNPLIVHRRSMHGAIRLERDTVATFHGPRRTVRHDNDFLLDATGGPLNRISAQSLSQSFVFITRTRRVDIQ